jgi:DNA-binding NtrC family response regulator
VSAIEKGAKPDIILQDYFLEKMNGIDVLLKVKKISPSSEFVFLTNNDSMEVAVNTIKYGAYDYIVKDKITLDKVVDRIQKIRKVKALESRNKQIKMAIMLFLGAIFLVVLFSVLYFIFGWFGGE